MVEERLIELLERVLGKSKKTTGDNYAFYSPFAEHYKPKLEINIKTTANKATTKFEFAKLAKVIPTKPHITGAI